MPILTTRSQRRELERNNAKISRQLALVPRNEWPLDIQHGRIKRVFRSRDFLVQEYEQPAPVLVRLSVLRTSVDTETGRWVNGISWDDLQRIKSECGYGLHDAVELFPTYSSVVNVANIRHLWVTRDLVTFAWRKGSAAS